MNQQERDRYLDTRWVGVGWMPIVRQLDRDLARIDRNYNIEQVKEKFGGLRYYYTTPLRRWEGVRLLSRWGWANALRRGRKMDKVVEEAERECWHTCEACGSTDGVTTGTWGRMKTLCARCASPKIPPTDTGADHGEVVDWGTIVPDTIPDDTKLKERDQ